MRLLETVAGGNHPKPQSHYVRKVRMPRETCTHCRIPVATDEDDKTLDFALAENLPDSDNALFGQELCWYPFTGEHTTGSGLVGEIVELRTQVEQAKEILEALSCYDLFRRLPPDFQERVKAFL